MLSCAVRRINRRYDNDGLPFKAKTFLLTVIKKLVLPPVDIAFFKATLVLNGLPTPDPDDIIMLHFVAFF